MRCVSMFLVIILIYIVVISTFQALADDQDLTISIVIVIPLPVYVCGHGVSIYNMLPWTGFCCYFPSFNLLHTNLLLISSSSCIKG